MHGWRIGMALAFALLALACGGAPRPNDQLAAAEAAMRAAEELKVQRDPQAELHMRLADEQTAKARKLIEDGEYEQAAGLLARARADAELAIALSKQASAEQERNAIQNSASPMNT